MLTQREIKLLNFLYKKLRGKHLPYQELRKYIHDEINLNAELSFELAYLYDKNFEKAKGDFNNVTEPERESYENYWDNIDDNIKILMLHTKDENIDKYEHQPGYDVVTYEGEEYSIYSDISDLETMAIDNADWICDDVGEHSRYYISMSDTDKRIYASEEADNHFRYLFDDVIISRANIESEIEEIENQRQELKDLNEKLEEFEKELHDNEDISEERLEELENEIEEIKSQIEDIGSEEKIDQRKENAINEARENLKEEYANEIENKLDDPYEYFVEETGIYRNARQLVNRGPVEFDCQAAKEDHFRDVDLESIVQSAGYDNYEEVRYGSSYYYIVWN